MSDYKPTKPNNQIARPSEQYPELVRKIIRVKIQADELAEELTSEKIANTFGVSRVAIDKHVNKERSKQRGK